jgi:hypothetical protein
VSMGLSSSPLRGQAVRGAMILSKEVRTVEVRGRHPRVLVVPVPFPANEILGFAPETPVAKNVCDFILNMTVKELDGGWGRGAAGERRIGCVWTQKPGVESVVDTAGKKGLGDIQTECNLVDTPRDGKWAAEFGR